MSTNSVCNKIVWSLNITSQLMQVVTIVTSESQETETMLRVSSAPAMWVVTSLTGHVTVVTFSLVSGLDHAHSRRRRPPGNKIEAGFFLASIFNGFATPCTSIENVWFNCELSFYEKSACLNRIRHFTHHGSPMLCFNISLAVVGQPH